MFKRIMAAALLVVLALTLGTSALAEQSKTMTVDGSAQVGVQADFATLRVGVQSKTETVGEAQKDNAATMDAIVAALKEAGIAKEDIITESFNVYSYEEGNYGEAQRTVYVLSNMLSVTVRDLSKAGSILDTAMSAGANILNGLEFDASERANAYKKALTHAVDDAKEKAQVLAAATGVTLGEVLSVQVGNPYSYAGAANYYKTEASGAAMDTAVISGDISVSASVTLVYEIQ